MSSWQVLCVVLAGWLAISLGLGPVIGRMLRHERRTGSQPAYERRGPIEIEPAQADPTPVGLQLAS